MICESAKHMYPFDTYFVEVRSVGNYYVRYLSGVPYVIFIHYKFNTVVQYLNNWIQSKSSSNILRAFTSIQPLLCYG